MGQHATRANLIHKCFVSRDTASLIRAFIVYVRPLLEYASPVWSPYHVGKIIQIESVQRRFTKRLPGLKRVIYKDRLQRLGLETLEMRRLRQDLSSRTKLYLALLVIRVTSCLLCPTHQSRDEVMSITYFKATVVSTLVNISLPSVLLNLGTVCLLITTLLRA